VEHLRIVQGDNKPICVFVGGIGTRWEDALAAGEEFYGGPAIGISAYEGDIIPDWLRAAADYLTPQGRSTGKRLLEALQAVCDECGQIDMLTFHSAAVVALNNGEVIKELDALLSSKKLRFGKVAFAGAHVQPELAAVLTKHKGAAIQDWVTLEQSPTKEKAGDLIAVWTTPNLEFENPVWAGLGKVGLLPNLVLSAVGAGNSVDRHLLYGLGSHVMENYADAAREFFGIPSATVARKKPKTQSRSQDKAYRRQDQYPPWWPDGGNFAAAGKDPGGVLFDRANSYLVDTSGLVRRLEEATLRSRPEDNAITWDFEHGGEKYKAVTVPVGKKRGDPTGSACYYDKQGEVIVLCQGDDVLGIRVRQAGSLLQILQIAEGKVTNRASNLLAFRITNLVFSERPSR
jgi:hypothetical protein